jgi:drug/metabolite transporter (DMT)-like permease
MSHPALLKLAVTVAIFGAAFPILKWGGAGASPLWFASWRAVLCLLVAGVVVLATGARRPTRADVPAILAIGVFQIAGFFALLQAALVFVPAGRASVLSYTTALWLVPISVLALGEKVGRRRLAAVALGLAGIAAIANPWALDWTAPGLLAGHALLLAAALSWAIAIAMLRAARPALSTLQMLPFAFALSTTLLLALSLALDPRGGIGKQPRTLAALGYVGVLGPIATWAATEVSRQLPAVVSSLGFLGVPILGLALSVLLLGEPLDLPLAAGAVLVIGGVAVAIRAAPGGTATTRSRPSSATHAAEKQPTQRE